MQVEQVQIVGAEPLKARVHRGEQVLACATGGIRVAGPAQLVAAASPLAATFPELAARLRRAAATR